MFFIGNKRKIRDKGSSYAQVQGQKLSCGPYADKTSDFNW